MVPREKGCQQAQVSELQTIYVKLSFLEIAEICKIDSDWERDQHKMTAISEIKSLQWEIIVTIQDSVVFIWFSTVFMLNLLLILMTNEEMGCVFCQMSKSFLVHGLILVRGKQKMSSCRCSHCFWSIWPSYFMIRSWIRLQVVILSFLPFPHTEPNCWLTFPRPDFYQTKYHKRVTITQVSYGRKNRTFLFFYLNLRQKPSHN